MAGLFALIVAAGCGGGSSSPPPTSTHATPPPGAPAPKPHTFPLARQKPTPRGVPKSVSFSSQGNAPCLDPLPRGRAVRLEVRDAVDQSFAEVAGRRLPVGALLAVCVYKFRTDLPVDAAVTVAGGPPLRYRWPAGDAADLKPWMILAAGRLGPGEHRLTISQEGAATRSLSFTIDGDTSSAGLWTDGTDFSTAGRPIMIGSGGNVPGAPVRFDFYTLDASDFYAPDASERYRYWTTIKAKADARGRALTVVPTRTEDARSFVVRQRGTRDAPTPIGLSGLDAGEAEGRPAGKPRSVFQRHDAPPAGVARQVEIFTFGGPSECERPKTFGPAVTLSREVPRPWLAKDSTRRYTLGDHVRVCAFGFADDRPVKLVVQRPDGSRSSRTYPAELIDQATVSDPRTALLIRPDLPTGSYRITARQGVLRASARLSVGVPTIPGYETTGTREGDPAVVVVGLPARQRFRLLLYGGSAQDDGRPPGFLRPAAPFVTSVGVQADGRGTAVYRLRRAPGEPKACFIVKVSYGEHVLDDLRNTLSRICVPDRTANEPGL
jgi:hypothetical protein